MLNCLTVPTLLLSLTLAVSSAFAAPQGPQSPQYRRNEIRDARFGSDQRQAELQQAYGVDGAINAEIFGQEYIAQAIRDKLAQYLEGFGQRQNEPVALNLMGLPGIGKSAMLKVLAKSGIQIVTFDAQKFTSTGTGPASSFSSDLVDKLRTIDMSKPLIVVIEELDKAAEVDGLSKQEKTQGIIGELNELLVDGKVQTIYGQGVANLSNAFVITTMNLAPSEITDFSKDALGEQKSYYDFTIDDFQKFHQWVISHPAAIPKLLSHLFRPNTVSRLAPLSVLVKPLAVEDYRKVTIKTLKIAIDRATKGINAKTRLDVTFSDAMVDYLNNLTTYAPSGARNTVTKTDILAEQLVNYAKRANDGTKNPQDSSLLTPRKVFLDFDSQSNSAQITITPMKIVKNKDLVDGTPFNLQVAYSRETGQFIQPKDLALTVPKIETGAPPKEDVILKKEVLASRFSPQSKKAKGLAKHINSWLFGQEDYAQILESEMNQYLARTDHSGANPEGIVFAGFPGIGKSEMINLTADYLKIPVIKINLQQYTTDSNDAVAGLVGHIKKDIQAAQQAGFNKYILLFEELDKIYEINAKGEQVNRPVMSIVKDIMNNGQTEFMFNRKDGELEKVTLDVRTAFVAATMNFAVDRFEFSADPRLTTIEDVQGAWRGLTTRLADLKKLLGSMFLPETVNRLISKVHILKPLGESEFKKVIKAQIDLAVGDRSFDNKDRDVTQIDLETTPAYRKYLYSESVVPSEGARFTANVSRGLVNEDLEAMIKKIPRNSKFEAKALTFVLDYNPSTKTVTGNIIAGKRKKDQLSGVYKREAELTFPPLNVSGKLSQKRIIVSIHEFGHALAAIRSGLPFESIVVVPPSNGTGGYVKFRSQPMSANEYMAHLYAALGARAMERVMLSPNPRQSDSVYDITAGASGDIVGATKLLFNALKAVGFDEFGGILERMGIENGTRYANFADIPHEKVEALGAILKDIENTLVEDFLSAHSREWYADKIQKLGHQGAMTERQYYELIETGFPGDQWQRAENDSMIFKHFKGHIQESEAIQSPGAFERYRENFITSVKSRLHPEEVTAAPKNESMKRRAKASTKTASRRANMCRDLFSN